MQPTRRFRQFAISYGRDETYAFLRLSLAAKVSGWTAFLQSYFDRLELQLQRLENVGCTCGGSRGQSHTEFIAVDAVKR
jgi:hypothetical protein